MITKIKIIRNAYGSLQVKSEKGKFYMNMNCEINNYEWTEITPTLYNELIELNEKNPRLNFRANGKTKT